MCRYETCVCLQVGYMKTNELAKVACDKADAHAVFEAQGCAKACVSTHVPPVAWLQDCWCVMHGVSSFR